MTEDLKSQLDYFKDEPKYLRKVINELEQENKELKEYSKRMENQRENYYKEYNKYRSALEEIKTYLNTLSSIDSDFTNTETYLRIQDTINEVLNLS